MRSSTNTRTERRGAQRSKPERSKPERPKPESKLSTRSGEKTKAASGSKRTSTTDADTYYDDVVHGGGSREPDDDVYDRLTRAEVEVEDGIVDDLDPANLVATLERGDAGLDDGTLEGALDAEALEASGDIERELLPDQRDLDDDVGTVSPEELGEQFLRGAAQQERRTNRQDAEPRQDVDLLSDAVQQVSLFDHNFDPLAEPQFPNIVADEAAADASHRGHARQAAKRADVRRAEERPAAATEPSTSEARESKSVASKTTRNGTTHNETTRNGKPVGNQLASGHAASKKKAHKKTTMRSKSHGQGSVSATAARGVTAKTANRRSKPVTAHVRARGGR